MDWPTILGFLLAMALIAVIWFAVVVPSERRDHERRLAILQKRIAEREELLQAESAQGGGVIKAAEGTIDDDHPGQVAERTRGGAPRPG